MPSVSGNVGAVASVSSVFGRNGGVVAANGDYSGVVAAHLTGATAATRYVGGTASGAPVAGTFAVGDFVIEQTGKVYVCTVAGTPGTWVAPGGASPFQTGAGSPAGIVAPTAIGALYIDETNGALYIAVGNTSASWVAVGGNSFADGTVTGVVSNEGVIQVLANGGTVALTDVNAFAGSGNGVYYLTTGDVDGDQIIFLQLGSTGQFRHMFAANGSYQNPNGIIFPTADPHIVGAWWDNLGTLTKSAG